MHTKGPWQVMKEYFIVKDSGVIAKTYIGPPPDKKTEEIWKDNARLIASAPELLEACKDALDKVNSGSFPNTIKRLEQAIAKAEGRDI